MPPRPLVALALVALALPACTRGARAMKWRPIPTLAPEAIEAATTPPPPAPDQIPGTPPVRVVWQALARTKPQRSHPMAGMLPTGLKAPPPEMKIVLLNASHPEAVKMRLRARENRSQRFEAEVAIVADADMNALMEDFESLDVFDYAKPTVSVEPMFKSDLARGRITIERGGESVTLLAVYGQGMQEATRRIPAMYADAKKLVAVLKNRTPNLSVTGFRTSDPRKPK